MGETVEKIYCCDRDNNDNTLAAAILANSNNRIDEASCLRAAYKVANDPDGYEGMIFCRWTADAIGKAIKLDWEKFV